MEYADAVDYVESLGKFGIHLGMERIQGLTALLDHPERKIRTVHVTGTNGKGSVTTFLANMLQQAGLKVGSYTSPHFVRYNERICLNGEEISNEDFAAVTERPKPLWTGSWPREENSPPSLNSSPPWPSCILRKSRWTVP